VGWPELVSAPTPPFAIEDCRANQAIAIYNSGAPLAKTHIFTANLTAICEWDGSQWTLLGRLQNPNHYPYEHADVLMTTFEGNLLVGGVFQSVVGSAATVLVNNLALWDGSQWQAFGSSLGGSFDPDSPTEVNDLYLSPYGLFVVGNFTTAGGKESLGFGRWAPASRNFVVNTQGVTVFGLADGITYQFPAGSFSQVAVFSHTDLAPGQTPPLNSIQAAVSALATHNLRSTGIFFQDSATYQAGGGPATLLKPVTLTIPYTDLQVFGFPAAMLGLYSWNGSQWVREPTSTVQLDQHTVTASPDHLGIFALLAEPKVNFLPALFR